MSELKTCPGTTSIQFPNDEDSDEGPPPALSEAGAGAEAAGASVANDTAGATAAATGEGKPAPDRGGGGDVANATVIVYRRDTSDKADDSSSSEEEAPIDDPVVAPQELNRRDDEYNSSGTEEGDVEDIPDQEMKWKQEDGANIYCECLICEEIRMGYEAADTMKSHIETVHDLSFEKLKTTFDMDYIGFVKFVGWAREMKKEKQIEESIARIWSLSPSEVPWLTDKYLNPQQNKEIDYFLTLDYFEPNESIPGINATSLEELVLQVRQLQLEKQCMVEIFKRVVYDGKFSRSSTEMGSKFSKPGRNKRILIPSPTPSIVPSHGNNSASSPRNDPVLISGRHNDEEAAHLRTIRVTEPLSRGSIGEHRTHDNNANTNINNDLYFDSYNEVGIHHEMIFDHPRTDSYRKAIADQRANIQDKVVMDVGCGTGILSMFCAQQNPRAVFAVDNSEILFDAMSNGFENGFENLIRYVRQDMDSRTVVDELSMIQHKVDVLVSEFMGYFLYFEGMTETFLKARDKFLKPDGIMLPDSCAVELVPIGSSGIYKQRVACWDNAYGFRMPAMQSRVLHETMVETVYPTEIIGDPVRVQALDLRTCDVKDIHMDTKFEFEFNQDDEFCAVAGYFIVNFHGPNNTTVLSTSPYDPPTHWKQAIFFLPKRFNVKTGEKMECKIRTEPNSRCGRWLVIFLTVGGITQRYEFR